MKRTCGAALLLLCLACSEDSDGGGATTIGGGDGGDLGCQAGATRCVGEVQEVCIDGLWQVTVSDACVLRPCSGDECEDPCARAAADRSYIGCEYWPIDLDNAVEVLGAQQNGACRAGVPRDDIEVCWTGTNSAGLCDFGRTCPNLSQCQTAPVCALDAQGSPFAVVVSNPDAEHPVEVTLETADGQSATETVPPGEVLSLFPQQLGLTDRSLDHSGISARAYKLTTDRPIVAYQFNPLDNVDVFSNDGSLLIPRHAYDADYSAISLPTLQRRPDRNDYSSYLAVVAPLTGTTRVEVTASTPIRAGEGVDAMQVAETRVFELGQFDVLNLEAEAGGDVTGTRVRALDDRVVGVFVGHEATVLSNQPTSPCCADHVEEQLFPISTWGSNFAIARSQSRNTGEPDMLRVLAHFEATQLEFEPAPAQGSCGVLQRGQFCDVFIQQDTVIRATQPVLVAHFLLSTGGEAGDPGMAFAVPFEQFRDSYTFLVPVEYDQQYISVVALANGEVLLDGASIADRLTPFSNAFVGGRIAVQPGQRQLTCPDGCGVEVYGYSQAVSYLFAGGLDLERITAP